MTFRIGQRVVCVDDKSLTPGAAMHGLSKGSVYTVRGSGICPFWNEPVIWLSEIVRPIEPVFVTFGEIGYLVRRFRPAVERKTSIEVFQKMLVPKKQRERA